MRILGECKRCLAIAGLTNDKFVQIGGKPVPRMLIRCLSYFALALITVTQFIASAKNYSHGLSDFLGPLQLGLSFFTITLIRISLILKSETIMELFDVLQVVVNRRKYEGGRTAIIIDWAWKKPFGELSLSIEHERSLFMKPSVPLITKKYYQRLLPNTQTLNFH